jgi:hydrogenase nickel incorporation protein HypB
MCYSCGCTAGASPRLIDIVTGQTQMLQVNPESHTHDDNHGHHHHDSDDRSLAHGDQHTIVLQEAVLGKNDRLAAQNREWLQTRHVVALNLVSAPGSGKTTILERTIRDLGREVPMQVIEGDQETVNDAKRIRSAGCPVVQINTGAGCHLESNMVRQALEHLAPVPRSIVMIENVGNLVCPALFDLGEVAKVIILSVTEGEDKPLKYPHMFRAAQLMLLNKIDLLPYLRFDVDTSLRYARMVNPDLEILLVSALSGDGMQGWYEWLRRRVPPEPGVM